MSLTVRPLEESDIDIIEASEPPGQLFVRTMWDLQQKGVSLLLVAWLDGVPVGSGQLDRRTDPIELKNLNVVPSVRGRGVGSALIRAAEALATPNSILSIGVGVDNLLARDLYERLGYRSTGEHSTTTYEYVDSDGERQTATETDVRMIKRLA